MLETVIQLVINTFFAFITMRFTDASKGPFAGIALISIVSTEVLKSLCSIISGILGTKSFLSRALGHLRYNLLIFTVPVICICCGLASFFSAKFISDTDFTTTGLPKFCKYIFISTGIPKILIPGLMFFHFVFEIVNEWTRRETFYQGPIMVRKVKED